MLNTLLRRRTAFFIKLILFVLWPRLNVAVSLETNAWPNGNRKSARRNSQQVPPRLEGTESWRHHCTMVWWLQATSSAIVAAVTGQITNRSCYYEQYSVLEANKLEGLILNFTFILKPSESSDNPYSWIFEKLFMILRVALLPYMQLLRQIRRWRVKNGQMSTLFLHHLVRMGRK